MMGCDDQDVRSLLHRLVFQNEVDALKAELEASHPHPHPNLKSFCRGLTPLTLAVQLHRTECIKLLLDAGSSTLLKSTDGWSPFQEATSIGDREVMDMIFRKRRAELGDWFEGKGKALFETLSKDVNDFYLEMHWTFSSWIPFVSNLCPSDTYKISKKGKSIRIDTTLVGFERLHWIRGDISIIFSESTNGPELVICDHQRHVVQQVYPRDFTLNERDIEEEISVCLNTNIIATPEINFQSFNLSRAQNGFWGFKADRSEKVGSWETSVWNVESFEFINRVRTEHLHVNPLPAQVKRERKAATVAAKKAAGGLVIANSVNSDDEDDSDTEWAAEASENAKVVADEHHKDWSQAKRLFRELAAFRGSLDAVPETQVSFEQFFQGDKIDEYLHVGRVKAEKVTNKAFKATLWMYNGVGTDVETGASSETCSGGGGDGEKAGKGAPTQSASLTSTVLNWIGGSEVGPASNSGPMPIQSANFPIQVSSLIPLLELIGMGSNQHVRSLREFFNVQLPPGFPVKIEIPMNLLPLSAVITFQNIVSNPELDPAMFIIPGKKQGYRAGEVIRGSTDTY